MSLVKRISEKILLDLTKKMYCWTLLGEKTTYFFKS